MVEPGAFLEQVGCVPLADRTSSQARRVVSLPVVTGERQHFDCDGVRNDSLHAATQRYWAAVGPDRPPLASAVNYPNPYTYPSWVLPPLWSDGWGEYRIVDAWESCETIPFTPDEMGGYYHESGAYQLIDIGTPTEECWVVVTWQWFQYDDPNGNWEDSTAGGDPPESGGGGGPPPPPPPPPMEPTDTVCRSVSKDTMTTRVGGNPVKEPGILGDSSIQAAMRALILDSYGPLYSPKPLHEREELGGVVYRMGVDSPFVFRQIPNALQSNCAYQEVPTSLPPGGAIVARIHTHPFRDSLQLGRRERYYCDVTNEPNQVSKQRDSGGGSTEDWQNMETTGHSWYTISPDFVFRLDPGLPDYLQGRSNAPWRYQWNNAACFQR